MKTLMKNQKMKRYGNELLLAFINNQQDRKVNCLFLLFLYRKRNLLQRSFQLLLKPSQIHQRKIPMMRFVTQFVVLRTLFNR